MSSADGAITPGRCPPRGPGTAWPSPPPPPPPPPTPLAPALLLLLAVTDLLVAAPAVRLRPVTPPPAKYF